jgi:large subunit ribosomal protein L17
MRHRVAGKRLGRTKGQRIALRRSLINQLFEHERLQTTEAKARAIRPDAEKLITLAKRGLAAGDIKEVNARRLANQRLNNPEAVRKLFSTLAPRYEERPGGYTRMLKLGQRQGDAAKMVILELVDRDEE